MGFRATGSEGLWDTRQCGLGEERLPETLLCFALQGDRGLPGPEGEKVGGLGRPQPRWGDACPALEQLPWHGVGGCPDTFLFLPSGRAMREPRGARGQREER